jgi:hypothetical protein
VAEEADESAFWLELLDAAAIVTSEALRALTSEANQLVAIFSAAQLTIKRNADKNRQTR